MRKNDFSLTVLIIIYKIELYNSETLNSLINSNFTHFDLIIWDNSPLPQNEQKLEVYESKFKSVVYISTPENLGLSKIYNKVISLSNGNLFLTLFDQDSIVPNDFFDILKRSIFINDSYLYIPIVKSHSRIVSPGNYFFIKGKRWKIERYGLLLSKNIVAINSGMTIRVAYFKDFNYDYNEKLNLYGIDIDFMLKYHKNVRELIVIRSIILHNSNLLDREVSVEEKLQRFRNRKHAWYVIHEKNILKKIVLMIYAFYYSIKMAVKNLNLKFLH